MSTVFSFLVKIFNSIGEDDRADGECNTSHKKGSRGKVEVHSKAVNVVQPAVSMFATAALPDEAGWIDDGAKDEWVRGKGWQQKT